MSADPAVGKYLPEVPTYDDARKRNENLPGVGGVFNPINLALYHYAGNNPVKYVDPTGRDDVGEVAERSKVEIVITRNVDPKAYQSEKPPAYYQDTLEIKKGGQTLLKVPVQASATVPGPKFTTKDGKTVLVENLSEGHHVAVAQAYSAGDDPHFKDILRIDNGEILVHPDAFNNKNTHEFSQPFSAGCQVPTLSDFNAITETLKHAAWHMMELARLMWM